MEMVARTIPEDQSVVSRVQPGCSTKPAVKRTQHQASARVRSNLLYQGSRSRWPWPPTWLQTVKMAINAIRNSIEYARCNQEGLGDAGAGVAVGAGEGGASFKDGSAATSRRRPSSPGSFKPS